MVARELDVSESRSRDDPSIVYVNVYDMTPKNKYVYPFGMGVYHSGVEVYGMEFAFGGHDFDASGIFQMPPRVGVPGITLRRSIPMGKSRLSQPQIADLVKKMSREYAGRAYHIIKRNCNHFSNDFCMELCGLSIPGWINRLALFGALLPCTIAPEPDWIPVPPNEQRSTGNGNNVK